MPVLKKSKMPKNGSKLADAPLADAPPADAPLGEVPMAEAPMIERIRQSLGDAEFRAHGACFEHDAGITVFLGDEMEITVDGIDGQDLDGWAHLQLAVNVPSFGARLIEWAEAQRSGDGFFDDDSEVDDGLDFLPTPERLGVDSTRSLVIYTWGKALRKSEPADSQHNFNAGILNGRGGGADLRTMNGTSDEVQRNVASCSLFPRWLEMACNKIETSTLQRISINCTKGRHRSVAAAEIMKKFYYPNAEVRHLTIR